MHGQEACQALNCDHTQLGLLLQAGQLCNTARLMPCTHLQLQYMVTTRISHPLPSRCPTCSVSRSKLYLFLFLPLGGPWLWALVAPLASLVPGGSTSATTSTVCLAVTSSQANGRELPGDRLSHFAGVAARTTAGLQSREAFIDEIKNTRLLMPASLAQARLLVTVAVVTVCSAEMTCHEEAPLQSNSLPPDLPSSHPPGHFFMPELAEGHSTSGCLCASQTVPAIPAQPA